jgi:transcriptional regulator with XRE-family HTH domain
MSSASPPLTGSQQVGDRLRLLRLARFMTQDQLAHSSGVGRVTIARLESGHTTPQMRTVRALAAALDVAPNELVPDPAVVWPRR